MTVSDGVSPSAKEGRSRFPLPPLNPPLFSARITLLGLAQLQINGGLSVAAGLSALPWLCAALSLSLSLLVANLLLSFSRNLAERFIATRYNVRGFTGLSTPKQRHGWFGVAVYGVRHINEVKPRRARLVLGLVIDLWQVCHPGIYPGPLSLAIPPWVGEMSTGDGFGNLCIGINGASEVTNLTWRLINQCVISDVHIYPLYIHS